MHLTIYNYITIKIIIKYLQCTIMSRFQFLLFLSLDLITNPTNQNIQNSSAPANKKNLSWLTTQSQDKQNTLENYETNNKVYKCNVCVYFSKQETEIRKFAVRKN